MKHKIFGIIIICICTLLTSCMSGGDEKVEAIFNGEWKCQYYIDIRSRKFRVEETTKYDSNRHTYDTRMKLVEIYPASVDFGTFIYGGKWKANDKFVYGKIDNKKVKFEVNPEYYDRHAQDGFYKAILKYLKDTRYKEDYFITLFKEDDIRLYSEDRDTSYDLYRDDDKE